MVLQIDILTTSFIPTSHIEKYSNETPIIASYHNNRGDPTPLWSLFNTTSDDDRWQNRPTRNSDSTLDNEIVENDPLVSSGQESLPINSSGGLYCQRDVESGGEGYLQLNNTDCSSVKVAAVDSLVVMEDSIVERDVEDC